MSKRRIGVFGGSFDPVHYGHLLLAEQCRESARLDQILMIPAAQPPHKLDQQLTDSSLRVEMLKLAIADHRFFEVYTGELDRGGVSFTVDTLKQLALDYPEADLFLMMGNDSLLEFHTWRDPKTICQLATPLVIRRPPADSIDWSLLDPYVSPQRRREIESQSFVSRQIEISSTRIRDSISNELSIRFQTPRAVEELIREKGLYQD